MSEARDLNAFSLAELDNRSVYTALQADVAGFARMAALLREETGINLPENQKNLGLMASRLLSTMRSHACDSYSQYLMWINKNGRPAIDEFIQCMTTNTTEFFREPAHYDSLRAIISGKFPGIPADAPLGQQGEIRVWCAAASSGQEPYSILMTLLAELERQHRAPDIKFLATDIDHSMLEHASRGVYSTAEIRSLPADMRERWFKPLRHQDDTPARFVADRFLRNSITFAPLNLVQTPYPFKHQFDIIFCRNVLIYFDRATGKKVVAEMARHLRPGGFLFLGHSEAGVPRPDELKVVSNAVYRKGS